MDLLKCKRPKLRDWLTPELGELNERKNGIIKYVTNQRVGSRTTWGLVGDFEVDRQVDSWQSVGRLAGD